MSWLDEVVESCGDSVSERLAEELHRAVIIAHEVQQQQRLQLEGPGGQLSQYSRCNGQCF